MPLILKLYLGGQIQEWGRVIIYQLKEPPLVLGWSREMRGDREKPLETTQLPLPSQILLAALIEACHRERSQLQIAFINELQQLQPQPQPQPQPNGGDTSSQAVPCPDSKIPNAFGCQGRVPQFRPQTLSWPHTLPSDNRPEDGCSPKLLQDHWSSRSDLGPGPVAVL